jgi:hypothetical protein
VQGYIIVVGLGEAHDLMVVPRMKNGGTYRRIEGAGRRAGEWAGVTVIVRR